MRWIWGLLLVGQAQAKPLYHQELYGKISMDISLVKVSQRSLPAWCYRTHGMKPEEVSVTVLRRPADHDGDYPNEPIQLLRSFARAGKVEYGVADFGGKSFLSPHFKGFLLVDGDEDKVVVPVYKIEMDVADAAGPSRVTGQLANQVRWYPYPFWCDRDRKPVYSDKDLEKMKSDAVLRSAGINSEATAMLADGALQLRLPTGTGKELSAKLLAAHSRGTALRVALRVDPRADCFLIWTSDSSRQAVSLPGSLGKRMSVQWLCFVPDQAKNECRQMDDGVAFLLTRKDYLRFAEGVKTKRFVLPIPGSEPPRLVAEEAPRSFHDPVSGATLRTTGSWFSVGSSKPTSKEVVRMTEVVLLTAEHKIGKNVGVKPLAAYIQAIEKLCQQHLIGLRWSHKIEIALNCRLRAGKEPEFRWAVKKPEPPKLHEITKGLKAALLALKAPGVGDEVHFQMRLEVKAK
ncbi:MAG: hypothetical protein J0I12_17730 [Candidatus Eremiobacteraeota bacterium]|nr:hypothetical protein [Candidatus Eremiobacteraeota bacterium]